MRKEWIYEKRCNGGAVVEKAHVVYYGGVTLCFQDNRTQRQFTSPSAARAQLAIEGFQLVEHPKK